MKAAVSARGYRGRPLSLHPRALDGGRRVDPRPSRPSSTTATGWPNLRRSAQNISTSQDKVLTIIQSGQSFAIGATLAATRLSSGECRLIASANMSVKILLSAVSDEFRSHRDLLRSDLTRHNVEVKVQEDFKDLGGETLDKLDLYISHCDAVVHFIGDMTGDSPGELGLSALRRKYPDLTDKLPPLGEALRSNGGVSYTHWEAWLAIYHAKLLFIAKAAEAAARGPKYAPTGGSRAAQALHLARLEAIDRFAGCTFSSADNLAKSILGGTILDLLVKAYAEESARARDVAEGFILEMAKKVASDRNLDFEGKKQAVRNAIDIYENEIAGGQPQTNIDAIANEALARARSLVDAGKSGLAQATLRSAAEAMRHEEEERRDRYLNGITALYTRARDIALAAYDGLAAAEAIILLAETVHGANTVAVTQTLKSEAATLYEYGRDRGSNVHFTALIGLRRKLLVAASSDDQRGIALHDLAFALGALGARESEKARLEEAVATYRAALEKCPRERAPLDWGMIQMDLGTALARLGERENRTDKLEEAVSAYQEALKEKTRERSSARLGESAEQSRQYAREARGTGEQDG